MSLISTHVELEDLGGGRFRHTQHLRPVACYDAGSLKRIMLSLDATGDASYPLGVANGDLYFKLDTAIAGKSPLYTFGSGKSRVAIALLDANNVKGVVSGQGVTFKNAWNNADLALTYCGHRLQKDILLRKDHPRLFRFRIDSHEGFDPATLRFGNDFYIQQPFLVKDDKSISLKWEVSSSGGKYILTCALPDGNWSGWTLDPTLTLQPDAANGQDTWIADPALGHDLWNSGVHTQVIVGRSSVNYLMRQLIRFPLSTIPATALCMAATLTLTNLADPNQTAAVAASLYHIATANGDWAEGTKSSATAGAGESCWAAKAADGAGGITTAWAGSAGLSTAGTDYTAGAIGTTSFGDDIAGTAYNISLDTTTVQSWFGQATNNGILIKSDDEATVGKYFAGASSDNATAARRPKLVIDYTGGTAVMGGVFVSGFRRWV